jgi:hypothetical protein
LAGSLLGIYLKTIAPGLTWANGGSDGGDLITAAATRGIAHPTGYPLYLLLAQLFQHLPVGSLAFRTNLMSAMATVVAALLVYAIVTRSLSPSKSLQVTLAAMTAGYCFGLAPLIWSQAVIAEVYALQAFLVVLIVYLYSFPVSNAKGMGRWRGLVLGLAMGNQITTIFLVPISLLFGSFIERMVPNGTPGFKQLRLGNLGLDGKSLRRQLVWFGLGLCVYLLIPLRAFTHPPVNWGNSVTFERFWWLVSGKLYQSYYLQTTIPDLWKQIQAWVMLLLQQFGILGLGVGLMGLVVSGRLSRLYILTVWTAAVSLAFTLFYRSVDSYVYLIPVFISFSIWIGLGIGGLIRQFPHHYSILGLGISLLLIGYFLVRPISYVSQVDASLDHRAETFGGEVLSIAPGNAVIFAKGDRAIFTLWYYHFALKERTDVIVLATELLHFDWYQEIIQSTYPSLIVPSPFSWPETISRANPQRPVCHVQYTDHAEIECTKPLVVP